MPIPPRLLQQPAPLELAPSSKPEDILATHTNNMKTAHDWRRQLLDLIDAVKRRESKR